MLNSQGDGSGGGGGANSNNQNGNDENTIGNRRKMFMSEKEKKEELIMKQRAELAIKKGTAQLDPAIEKAIAMGVLEALETELTKLLLVDGDGASTIDNNIRTNLPISRKSIQDNILVNHTQFGTGSLDLFDMTNSGPASGSHNNGGNGGNNKNSNSNNFIRPVGDINAVNLEDLFHVDNFDNPHLMMPGGYNNMNESMDTRGTDDRRDAGATGNNEFAAELLYIMKTSISLS